MEIKAGKYTLRSDSQSFGLKKQKSQRRKTEQKERNIRSEQADIMLT